MLLLPAVRNWKSDRSDAVSTGKSRCSLCHLSRLMRLLLQSVKQIKKVIVGLRRAPGIQLTLFDGKKFAFIGFRSRETVSNGRNVQDRTLAMVMRFFLSGVCAVATIMEIAVRIESPSHGLQASPYYGLIGAWFCACRFLILSHKLGQHQPHSSKSNQRRSFAHVTNGWWKSGGGAKSSSIHISTRLWCTYHWFDNLTHIRRKSWKKR